MHGTTEAVWVKGVDYEHATLLVKIYRLGPIPHWDDRVWRYWRELGWDQRPPSELDIQPPEVQAFAIPPEVVRALGLWQAEDRWCVLFVFPEIQWAAVASNSQLVADADLCQLWWRRNRQHSRLPVVWVIPSKPEH